MTSLSNIEQFRSERMQIMTEGSAAKERALELRETNDEYSHTLEMACWAKVDHALDRYQEMLPEVALSRSPLTGEIITWGMDIVDLDGWFWRHSNPIRPQIEKDITFRAATGAMRLREPVAWTDFVVEPGPAVPYVIPEILNQSGMVAVIAQIDVGPHTGWPIVYFNRKQNEGHLENEWGGRQYTPYDDDGNALGWSVADTDIRRYDFDLAPWIIFDKLHWIAPNDPTMTLRQGMDGCPYAKIEGPRKLARIERGEVRYYGLEDLS